MRFFLASGCPIATTTRYRCLHLREQLQAIGHETEVANWFDEEKIDPAAALRHEVIVLYRLPMSPPLADLIERARLAGKALIFDTDDLIFEPELVSAHRGVLRLSPNDQELHLEGVRRYLETLQAADVITTATPLLAEFAIARGKRAFVHRNALGNEMLELADRLYRRRQERAPSERVIIGYGSGTPTHDFDFREAATPLLGVLANYPEVELWIAGPLDLPREFEAFGDRVRRFPLTDWQGWFELSSQWDIALAPLELDNVFCRAKSEIKFLEAGALGVPVIASEIDPFKDAIICGENGLLARTAQDWSDALRALIAQPERWKALGENARRTILAGYTSRVRAAELVTLLPQMLQTETASR